MSKSFLKEYSFDLHLGAFGQLMDGNARASWEIIGEELGVCFVHGREIGHVSEEDSCLDGIV